jgi:hypothetical protein
MTRPTSVTVFGILNIVFAGFGLIGTLATLAMFKMAAGTNNPALQIMQDNPAFAAWIKLSIPLGLISSVALLAGGIGLLMMKSWARKLSIIYAFFAMVLSIVGTVLNYLWMIRPMMEQAAQKQGPEAAGAIGGAIGGLAGGCFSLIYPVLLLIFMTRPKVVAAFHPAAQSSDFPPA